MNLLETTYMGLHLKNPIIVGSSGLCFNIDNLINLESAGAAAVVLKSIFEEEIHLEHSDLLSEDDPYNSRAEQLDYLDINIRKEKLDKFTRLITKAKKHLSIPVIASINCSYSIEWVAFAKEFAKVGADAIELNLFISPSDEKLSSTDIEELYFSITNKVKQSVNIPVAVKITNQFTSLYSVTKGLAQSGADGLVLFNRFFSPDFDIDKMVVKPSFVFSTEQEIAASLRWIGLLHNRVDSDFCASTGIHDGEAVIKAILAGASAVQITSVLYKHGFSTITLMIKFIEKWMESKHYTSIGDFKGKLSYMSKENPGIYERQQFMKYFGKNIV